MHRPRTTSEQNGNKTCRPAFHFALDQIDINLLEAWTRIGRKCARNPELALQCWRRSQLPSVRRPPRAVCMCLRASDRRINEYRALIEPRGADENIQPHTVTLNGTTIGWLNRPVTIDWPGVTLWIAAEMYGISKNMANKWMQMGFLRQEGKYRGEVPGKPWIACPKVWTPSPMDPNHYGGLPPDQVWGSLWQWFWNKLPEHFEQTLQRVPRYTMRLGRPHLQGWDWVCPGRSVAISALDAETDANDSFSMQPRMVYKPCGKLCRYLFAPLPTWTLAKATGVRLRLAMPADSGLCGSWEPGMQDIEIGRGHRSFACRQCWNLSNVSLNDCTGWNTFVAHLSGGLLYGMDVERPEREAPRRKRKPYAKRRTRAAKDTQRATRQSLMITAGE